MLLSSDIFSKFLLCEVSEESFWCIFTIYATKNEAVFCEVQTDFESSLPANFAEKVPGAYSQFLHPKMKLFAMRFRCNVEVFALQGV